ncbi:MAG TPA: chloride channel protein [Chthoniobacterales bacterium]|nr:chloride channel protein [Chthoniobacterales bacterium]
MAIAISEIMSAGRITGIPAVTLAVAKLATTTAVYAWGGAGGIFSPTLFFDAAAGLALSQPFSLATHLPPNEQLPLTVADMSARLGAVVRAPITSILIVFEMTHQFAFVPLLMIGALASQAVSRAFCHTDCPAGPSPDNRAVSDAQNGVARSGPNRRSRLSRAAPAQSPKPTVFSSTSVYFRLLGPLPSTAFPTCPT